MSFVPDKKREHEEAAEKALEEKDYSNAFFHTAKAAEFGLILAEQSEGKLARRYVADAFELIEIATELKARARKQAPERAARAFVAADGSEDSSPTKWNLPEKPDERLDDVAGLDEVKQELREKVIEPFLNPGLYERFKVKTGGGVLMYGPPGTGKTFVAKAIAGEVDAAFLYAQSHALKDKYVGETEKNIHSLFEEARKHDRAVIFLDDVDHLLHRRGNQKIGAVSQFLTELDGIVTNSKCLLALCATNKPWNVDEAIARHGRLGTHIYVGPPDAAARQAIVAFNMREVPVAADLSFTDIATRTDGYSGADVAELCDRAKLIALQRESTSGNKEEVTIDDFTAALEKVRPSITAEMIEQFETWQRSGLRPAGAGGDND